MVIRHHNSYLCRAHHPDSDVETGLGPKRRLPGDLTLSEARSDGTSVGLAVVEEVDSVSMPSDSSVSLAARREDGFRTKMQPRQNDNQRKCA
jgi:hypothetical protein